jgi:hypothetical protein
LALPKIKKFPEWQRFTDIPDILTFRNTIFKTASNQGTIVSRSA